MLRSNAFDVPKDGVCVAVFAGDRILCVQHNYGQNFFGLPCGGLEEGDRSLIARAKIEVRQETGLRVRIVRPLGFFNLQRQPDRPLEVVYLFLGDQPTGKLGSKKRREIAWCGYLTLEQIRAQGVGLGKFGHYQRVLAECAFERRSKRSAIIGFLTKTGISSSE